MIGILSRVFVTACASTLLLFSAGATAGGMVLVDQGDMYSSTGQKWPNLSSTIAEPALANIPFALNFGSGPLANRQVFVNPHGQVQFGDGSGVPSTGDFLNILYNPVSGSAGQFVPGLNISRDLGLVDPSLIDFTVGPNFGDMSKGLQAYRFLFNGVCPGNDLNCSPLQFEAVFFYLTDNAFILEFNYGSNFFDQANPFSNFMTGFHLGANNVTALATDGTSTGPDYCFNNGVASTFSTIARCSSATSTTVPEPSTLPMMALGAVIALGTANIWNRRRSPRHGRPLLRVSA